MHCQVFVSDCDHTLWNGIVSEDGVHGLKFSGPYLELQRKLSELQKAHCFLGNRWEKPLKTSGVLRKPRKLYGFVSFSAQANVGEHLDLGLKWV